MGTENVFRQPGQDSLQWCRGQGHLRPSPPHIRVLYRWVIICWFRMNLFVFFWSWQWQISPSWPSSVMNQDLLPFVLSTKVSWEAAQKIKLKKWLVHLDANNICHSSSLFPTLCPFWYFHTQTIPIHISLSISIAVLYNSKRLPSVKVCSFEPLTSVFSKATSCSLFLLFCWDFSVTHPQFSPLGAMAAIHIF